MGHSQAKAKTTSVAYRDLPTTKQSFIFPAHERYSTALEEAGISSCEGKRGDSTMENIGRSREGHMPFDRLLQFLRQVVNLATQFHLHSHGDSHIRSRRQAQSSVGVEEVKTSSSSPGWITALDQAEQRTKNRCLSHRLVEDSLRIRSWQVPGHIGIECILVSCTNEGCDCGGYRGWLPVRDVRIDYEE